MAYMDRERQHTVYTHFIKPFLSRNDSSGKGRCPSSIWWCPDGIQWLHPANVFLSGFFADPGCVSFDGDSEEWLRANLGGFSGFATLQDLQALNANFSSVSGTCGGSIPFSQTEMSFLWLCNSSCLILHWFPLVGRIVVSAHSYSGGTVYTELRGLEWHKPNRPCVWPSGGGRCSGKCGRIPDGARGRRKGRVLLTPGKERQC